MRRPWLTIMPLLLGLLLAWSGSALPQGDPETTRMLVAELMSSWRRANWTRPRPSSGTSCSGTPATPWP